MTASSSRKKIWRIAIILALLAAMILFFSLDPGRFLTLDELKARQQSLTDLYHARPFLSVAAYMGIYILVTALSLPGAAVMSLAGAAIFGLWTGIVAVSFASSIGAALAFLCSRFLLRDWVRGKFGDRLAAINRGMEKEGGFYLFALRLVPVFPFFIINLVMGLTPIRTLKFYLVSQAGMLPGTVVYVYAGTRLGAVTSLSGILNPGLLFSFVLLGVFPLIAKRAVEGIRGRKALSAWPRPGKFDYNGIGAPPHSGDFKQDPLKDDAGFSRNKHGCH